VHRLAICLALVGCAADDPGVGDELGLGDHPAAGTVMPPSTATIDEVVAWLDSELAARSPGTDISITVEDLQTAQRTSLRGDALHVSASSAKAWWVAAAVDEVGVDAVAPYATPVFRDSDNSAAGDVIDLIGPNAVNTWMWTVAGMNSSALTHWSVDKTRIATNSPRAMGDDNYMTSDDAVTFLSRLYRGQILAGAPGATLEQWMTLSPDSGVGGWLPARLPADIRTTVMHKAGWLDPGCCSDDSYYNTSNEIGIVATPFGRAYAISILARHGKDYWNAQVPFVELASCAIYRAFVQDDTIPCE
jgi:beta-lactamase class A